MIAVLISALMISASAWAGPTLKIVAPDVVRKLLEQHLVQDAPETELPDDGARATLERRLRREASELLATEGYFSPQIELSNRNSETTLQVEPGLIASIGKVDIEIRGPLSAERRQELGRNWQLPAGSAFRQFAWDEAKRGFLRELSAVDFADARLLSSKAEVDTDASRVDLQLVFASGPRYRYGELSILGLTRYSETLVAGYNTQLRPGDSYRHEDLLALQSTLQNTPYFSSVSVELARDPAPAAADGATPEVDTTDQSASANATEDKDVTVQAPVIVRLRERAPYSVALGAGASSNTGARVEANFSNADFLSRALELNSGVRLEQLRQSVYADVFFPPDSKRQRDSVGSVIQNSDIQGLGIESVAFAIARLQMRGSIEQRLGINLQQERQFPEDGRSSTSRALAASIGWTWRQADDPLDASVGTAAQLQLAGASKALLSDQNFLRTYLRYSQGMLLGTSGSLLLRGEVGVTAAPSRQGIPQDYLFRAGGANSVRGYNYQSLGVKEGGATLGGRYLITLSAEYTHWLDDKWGIATFVDTGQAADDRKLFTLVNGYGLGARWKSPAGPLAIDVAWGEFDTKPHLHFSLAIPF